MLNIEIKTIPDKEQEYNTVGTYREENGKLIILVSDMNNWKNEILIALHELVESSLCKARDIELSAVVDFDKKFERKRNYGVLDEPGNDKEAPYYKEHQFAIEMEKLFARELGVDWEKHNELIMNLDNLILEK